MQACAQAVEADETMGEVIRKNGLGRGQRIKDERREPLPRETFFISSCVKPLAQMWCRPKEMEEMDMQEELGHTEGREDPVSTQTVLIVEDDEFDHDEIEE